MPYLIIVNTKGVSNLAVMWASLVKSVRQQALFLQMKECITYWQLCLLKYVLVITKSVNENAFIWRRV